MDSVGDAITIMMKTQNSACIVGKNSGDSLVTPSQHLYAKIPSSEHSAAVNHGIKSAHQQNGFSKSKTHTLKSQLEAKSLYDVGDNSSCDQVSGFESKCCIEQSETCDSNNSVGVAAFRVDRSVKDGLLVNPLAPQSEHTCPSPQNSFHSATQSIEGKESLTTTESSDCHSSIEKLGESGEVSQSFDFVESRKVSSTYRCSTGSDVSDESSSSSISSTMYKPHKVNDSRWIAIRKAQSHYGLLQLNHFRLLKQLGCGDIGKVYLAELVGTRTYFAMKVMNKAALESRKKLSRAQTEREILQSLDHPFLPTLYSHFETENHSCLVMEFCPGGDLHSLRQRQPHKCFPEHAARWDILGLNNCMDILFWKDYYLLSGIVSIGLVYLLHDCLTLIAYNIS